MFAVIADGGRQFQVRPGDTLEIDYRADAHKGEAISFDQVLLANGGAASAIGRPTLEGASVTAEVVIPQAKGEKLEIQKIRRRKDSKRHTGHRQKYTAVRITQINVPGLEIVEPAIEEPVESPGEPETVSNETATTDESADTTATDDADSGES